MTSTKQMSDFMILSSDNRNIKKLSKHLNEQECHGRG